MSTPQNDAAIDSPEYLAAKNVATVTMAIGVMSVVLGVFAVVMSSLSLWLAIFTVLEAVGVFFMATRLPADSLNVKAESRVRAARGLAMLGIALAVVAVVRSFL